MEGLKRRSAHPAGRSAPAPVTEVTVRGVMTARQQTISREVSQEGPGLFSGEPARLTFAPAEPGSGITFVREQDGKVATIPALVSNVLKRPRRTCLRNGTLH